jgi:hypothetical protein
MNKILKRAFTFQNKQGVGIGKFSAPEGTNKKDLVDFIETRPLRSPKVSPKIKSELKKQLPSYLSEALSQDLG